MRLPEQMHRQPNFDIRSAVHTGIDFDLNGHFTPLFDGVVYLMIPQWANASSIDDLKKIRMNISGHEIDFSRLDFSRFDQTKLNSYFNINEKPQIPTEEINTTSNESKSWFSRWFGNTPTPSPSIPSPPPPPTPNVPLTRKICSFIIKIISLSLNLGEMLLIEKLIDTFFLSNEAKKYTIADQFEIASGPWHMIAWFFVAGSFFLPFTLYTRLRFQFQTRLRRFLFFHFLLLNGLLCFYLSPFLGRLINMQVSRIRDSITTSYGLDILEGGIEFLEKQLERNRILRELLPNGKDFFDPDGERTKTRVPIPYTNGLSIPLHHWNPLIGYRLKRLKANMEKFMSAPEAEARKTIFKPLPPNNLRESAQSLR
jgi:hypothetical protein